MASKRKHTGPQNTQFLTIEHVIETGSTNRDLLDAAESGADAGLVLLTDHQTAGRGRQGRTWVDEPGRAMLASWLLRPSVDQAGLLPLLTGLAVAEVLQDVTGASIGVKWPNDVLAISHQERKLAGILAEATTTPSFAVVIGCGLNLSFGAHPPAGDGVWAIDVEALVPDAAPSPLEMLRLILTTFDGLYGSHEAGDRTWFDRYRDRCTTLGRTVRMDTPGGVISGRAADIDPGGGLVIEREGNAGDVVVTAGDAHHIGPPAVS